ncbi:190_t:CDS:2, partial [Entrophospora sp. SA101]
MALRAYRFDPIAVFPTLKSLVNTVPTEIVNSNDIPASEIIITTSQHLAQLCDKAFDAEDGANRANQEEIFMLGHLWKGFQDNARHQNSETAGPRKISSETDEIESLLEEE